MLQPPLFADGALQSPLQSFQLPLGAPRASTVAAAGCCHCPCPDTDDLGTSAAAARDKDATAAVIGHMNGVRSNRGADDLSDSTVRSRPLNVKSVLCLARTVHVSASDDRQMRVWTWCRRGRKS